MPARYDMPEVFRREGESIDSMLRRFQKASRPILKEAIEGLRQRGRKGRRGKGGKGHQ